MDQTTAIHSKQDSDGALTVAQFCAQYGIGRTAVYEEIGTGRLTAKKRGARTLIERAEARRWLASLPEIKSANQPSTRGMVGGAQ